ncbi:hypothetical protein BD769DRAFT_1676477 [Suillus cothurnatus]|nr:hypothetical protein BD769DRAFT_1676477 [Suillus cothurnatus]
MQALFEFRSTTIGHSGTIESLAWDPNHCRLASAGDGHPQVWNLTPDKTFTSVVSQPEKQAYVARTVHFYDKGTSLLVSYLESGDVFCYLIEPWDLKWHKKVSSRIGNTAVDGNYLLVSNLKDGVDKYTIPALACVQSFNHVILRNVPLQISVARQSGLLFIGGDDGFALIFDYTTGAYHGQLNHGNRGNCITPVVSHEGHSRCVVVTGTCLNGHSSIKVWGDCDMMLEEHAISPTSSSSSTILQLIRFAIAITFLSLEAEVASEDEDSEGEESEEDRLFVVPDDNITDNESDNNAVHPSSPMKDVGAWDIFWEHLTTDMLFEEMLEKLRAYLGVRYRKEDWKEAVDSLFTGDGDINIALDNLACIKARYIPLGGTLTNPSSSCPSNSFMDAVEDIDKWFGQRDVRPSCILSDERDCDVGKVIAPRMPGQWVVTVPASKTSFLAASIKAFGLKTYTHPTLRRRLYVTALNSLIIRAAFPPSHADCLLWCTFTSDDQTACASMAIPGWYCMTHGAYNRDIAYGLSYDDPTKTVKLLVASRRLDDPRDIGKLRQECRLLEHPAGVDHYKY